MRVMVKFQIPVETGNDVVRSGKINQILEKVMGDLKPEAAYMFAEDGQRAGLFVCDMQESSQIVAICEPLWFGLNAEVQMVPVMAAEDLMKGLGGIGEVISKYG